MISFAVFSIRVYSSASSVDTNLW